MTEINSKNREIYLDICKTIWNFDDASMEYLKHRTSDEWEPVPELKSLISSEGATYEDQRLRFDMDMGNETVQNFFAEDDSAYALFKTTFRNALGFLKDSCGVRIGYKEFIENKVVYKKNQTKIKKVFEAAYAEKNSLYESDSSNDYSKQGCADWITKKFERIGASKKSAKKLQLVVSFNPLDWLLASTGGTISSCFNLDNPGGGYSYCMGIPFLSGDKNRMMLYITDGQQKEFMGIKVDSPSTRTWCILDKSGGMNIVKWYPNDTVGVSPVNAITKNSRFKNRDTFREGKYPIDVLSTKKGAVIGVYSDMGEWTEREGKLIHIGNGKTGQQCFTRNLINTTDARRTSFKFTNLRLDSLGIQMPGYRIKEWKKLGLHLDMMFPTMRCTCCGEDKAGFSLDNGDGFLCLDCYKDQVFICKSCGGQHFKKNGYVEVTDINDKKIAICKSCNENNKNRICSCCGKYSTSELFRTVDDERVCKVCVDSGKYYRCEKCKDLTKNIKVNYNTYSKQSSFLCNNCDTDDTMPPISTFKRYFGIANRKAGRVSE